jgi:His-Xaa-Ser system protein HxsD
MSLSANSCIFEGNKVQLSINLELYNLNAIKKTAYKFANQCSILLQDKQASYLSVVFTFVENLALEQMQQVISDFCNELMDQELRQIIARDTEATRNLILAQAFSKTSLITS